MLDLILAYPSKTPLLGINLYAICILIGIVIAYIMGIKEGKKLGINKNDILIGVVIIVPIAIVGARLWYTIFNLDRINSISKFFGFENGKFVGLQGLAIQGAIIASLIAIVIYVNKKKMGLFKVFDIVAPGFLIGQIFGRYGNFFNQELYGPIVQNETLIKMIIPSFILDNMYIDGALRHPAFFYESCLNLLGLTIILISRRKYQKLLSGDLIGFYLVWYGIVRSITESIRLQSGVAEPLMLGPIPVSILISVLGIIAGVLYLVLKRTIPNVKKENYQEILSSVNEKKIDTVIFDLDGTLLNTKPLIDHTFVYTFQHYFPDKELTDEELNSFFGPTLEETFSRYTSDPKQIEEMIEFYRAYNKEHHNEFVTAFEGARSLLRTLHNKGYIVCVVSSKIKDMVEYGLSSFGLLQYVDYIIGEGEIIPKPNPEGILLAMAHFKNAKNGIYIGDNPSDILAGKNANEYYLANNINKTMKTCGVMYSEKLEEVKEIEPNYLINHLYDLIDVVNL
jgi:phosphatidylglycerol:prolipoprotein diacylglycerol transferase